MRSSVKARSGELIYLTALRPRLSMSNPVLEFDLSKPDVSRGAAALRRFGNGRRGGTLTIALLSVAPGSQDQRLTLTTAPPPAYEQRAAGMGYVRGSALRVQAGPRSRNIVLTRPGAIALAAELIAEAKVAKDSVHVVVERGNGKRDDLVYVIADAKRAARPSADDDRRLAQAGLGTAVLTWGGEDFSDWEDA